MVWPASCQKNLGLQVDPDEVEAEKPGKSAAANSKTAVASDASPSKLSWPILDVLGLPISAYANVKHSSLSIQI